MMRAWRVHRSSFPAAPLLAWIGGGAVGVGAWLPWMSYFAGLVPLRGVIGLYGRLLLAAGVVGLMLGIAMAWSTRPRVRLVARRAAGVLGLAAATAAGWLLLGVWELTRVHRSNAMLAPRPGAGLLVVLLGGGVLMLAAWVSDRSEMQRRDGLRFGGVEARERGGR
jgi:hypothetical protein